MVRVHCILDAIEDQIVNDYRTKSSLPHLDLKNYISSEEETCISSEISYIYIYIYSFFCYQFYDIKRL